MEYPFQVTLVYTYSWKLKWFLCNLDYFSEKEFQISLLTLKGTRESSQLQAIPELCRMFSFCSWSLHAEWHVSILMESVNTNSWEYEFMINGLGQAFILLTILLSLYTISYTLYVHCTFVLFLHISVYKGHVHLKIQLRMNYDSPPLGHKVRWLSMVRKCLPIEQRQHEFNCKRIQKYRRRQPTLQKLSS